MNYLYLLKNTYHQMSLNDRARAGSLPNSHQAIADQLPHRRGNSQSFAHLAEIGILSGRPR